MFGAFLVSVILALIELTGHANLAPRAPDLLEKGKIQQGTGLEALVGAVLYGILACDPLPPTVSAISVGSKSHRSPLVRNKYHHLKRQKSYSERKLNPEPKLTEYRKMATPSIVKSRPRDDKNHHIYRLDAGGERIHTWRVQVRRRGETVMRHFADQIYGGKRAALQAARAFRDDTLAKIDAPAYRRWNAARLRSNNVSGIAGVWRYAPRVLRGVHWVVRPFWQAYWVDAEGKKRSRKFSVDKYGEAGAKRRAIAARKAALDDIYGPGSTRQQFPTAAKKVS